MNFTVQQLCNNAQLDHLDVETKKGMLESIVQDFIQDFRFQSQVASISLAVNNMSTVVAMNLTANLLKEHFGIPTKSKELDLDMTQVSLSDKKIMAQLVVSESLDFIEKAKKEINNSSISKDNYVTILNGQAQEIIANKFESMFEEKMKVKP